MLKAILLYPFGKVFLPPSVIHISYGIHGQMHSNGPIRENNIGQYFLHGMYAPLYNYFPMLTAEKMPLFCITLMTNENSNDQIHMQTVYQNVCKSHAFNWRKVTCLHANQLFFFSL